MDARHTGYNSQNGNEKLKVDESQQSFVSANGDSLAQAYVYSETAFPFAVYEDSTIVGFIMMGYYEAKAYYTLWKFMIDSRYQNKGYGRQALEFRGER